MAAVQGTCEERFGGVRDALEANLASGEELGASVFVDLDGETVVDLWGGHRDQERTTAWTEDTITNVWSTTKTVTSLAALVLVERGLLDVHAPVARYWPEFAAQDKQDIEVRHLMSHTSGVSGWEQPIAGPDIYDLATSTARLAAQAPWWEPGTASGYHASSQGHLIGELVRRVTGMPLKEFVAREIAGPLGADFQIGAAERRADLGALNGHGNARSVARVLSVISQGGAVDGVRLLSPETIGLVFEEQSNGPDLVLGVPLRFGIGFALPQRETVPYVPDGRICFWGGWGGSLIVMDLDRRMTVAYMMNKMGAGIIGSPRSESYLTPLYAALGVTGLDPAAAAHA